MTGNMNFTSPHSRKEAINQIYKCARVGLRVGPPTKVDNLLRRWDISRARHDEIFRCAERDLQALAPTENGLHIHTFLKECFDIDTNKSKKAAYGDWTKNEPPRDQQLYNAFAEVGGGARGKEDGIYGDWECDIRPMLLDMNEFITCLRKHLKPETCDKRLPLLSKAMEISPSIDHEGEFAEAYRILQEAKCELQVRCKITRKRKNSETSLECDWPELVRRVKEHYGDNSAEYLLVSLFRNMPYRGDLHALTINPVDRSTGNFISIDDDTATIVIHHHKTDATYGKKIDVLDADVRELVRRFIESNGLSDGDFLLGGRPHSGWINEFLTTVGIKKACHARMHLLRHTWATSYANRVISQYDDGLITAEEYDDARERLCYLMCHTPEANEKYMNPIKTAE